MFAPYPSLSQTLEDLSSVLVELDEVSCAVQECLDAHASTQLTKDFQDVRNEFKELVKSLSHLQRALDYDPDAWPVEFERDCAVDALEAGVEAVRSLADEWGYLPDPLYFWHHRLVWDRSIAGVSDYLTCRRKQDLPSSPSVVSQKTVERINPDPLASTKKKKTPPPRVVRKTRRGYTWGFVEQKYEAYICQRETFPDWGEWKRQTQALVDASINEQEGSKVYKERRLLYRRTRAEAVKEINEKRRELVFALRGYFQSDCSSESGPHLRSPRELKLIMRQEGFIAGGG